MADTMIPVPIGALRCVLDASYARATSSPEERRAWEEIGAAFDAAKSADPPAGAEAKRATAQRIWPSWGESAEPRIDAEQALQADWDLVRAWFALRHDARCPGCRTCRAECPHGHQGGI